MSEINGKNDFEELLEDYISPLEKGSIVKGRVVKISQQSVLVSIGTKTECVIPVEEFISEGEITVKEGELIEAKVKNVSNALAQIELSIRELKIERDLHNVKDAMKNNIAVPVKMKGITHKGFVGKLSEIDVYIPKSHIDQKGRLKDDDYYINKTLQCLVLKIDEDNRSVLASHRLYCELLEEKRREEFFAKVKVGDVVKGRVKMLKKYGAFVDLGPIDAFLYKDNISWRKINDPTYYLEVDDIVEAVVLNVDKTNNKVEISIKDKTKDPWESVRTKYQEGSKVKGSVITKKNNGYVLEIEEGIDGFIPNEEISWFRKNDKRIERRSILEGQVIGYDDKKRRVLMSLKLIESNPWEELKKRHPEGSIVKGTIKDIKDFGMFVDFGGAIDGLIRISDISWNKKIENIRELYKAGDTIEAKILKIDPVKEQIQLGIKQLTKDPWSEVDKLYPKGKVVEGTIERIENRYIEVNLPGGLKGTVKWKEIDESKTVSKEEFKIGDTIKALVMDIDHKRREIMLSVRLYKLELERKSVNEYLKDYDENNNKFSLGSILKDKLKK
jgi:ribosomal protein S1